MHRSAKVISTILGTALAVGVASAGTASADTGVDASPRKKREGSVTCFNYSWGDDGIATYTVYYHNTCAGSHGLKVTTNSGFSHECIQVKGGAKGHKVFLTKPIKFEYKKSC
ncbi:hypothetical protein [Streptomyces sp. NPDC029674]|uniref:hypothetical protein n=1 Tax=Streptomyces sp. NPDC029674 TaxID=3365297 RepID=UPI00384DD50D